MSGRRIGILGGTFDPIHIGHLEAAAAAQRALHLDEVLLMPSLTPAHRHVQPHASAFHRFAMVALAVVDHERFIASDEELRGNAPAYTSDTLGRLHANGWRPTDLFFLLGSDAFSDIAAWHKYPDVLAGAHFVVITRPGTAMVELQKRVPDLVAQMIDPASWRPCAASLRQR
jgi:nicotinate-nucleotide adenylyltransferase